MIAHFAAGELRPIPFQAIPVSRAAEAFRAMQQSRHVGKLVVTMQADQAASLAVVRHANPIQANATYLVTGGLGGFGLATAEWLVEQGATSLALLSRRGAVTEEAIAASRNSKRWALMSEHSRGYRRCDSLNKSLQRACRDGATDWHYPFSRRYRGRAHP